MFTLSLSQYFVKKLQKLTSKNPALKDKISTTLKALARNPLDPPLKSHKVQDYWSSSVTGDIRIIWQYGDDKIVKIIEVLDIGGHSGSNRVYNK